MKTNIFVVLVLAFSAIVLWRTSGDTKVSCGSFTGQLAELEEGEAYIAYELVLENGRRGNGCLAASRVSPFDESGMAPVFERVSVYRFSGVSRQDFYWDEWDRDAETNRVSYFEKGLSDPVLHLEGSADNLDNGEVTKWAKRIAAE